MRFVTMNIHHGETLQGRLDLDRIIGLLTEWQPDVVALQEVDRRFGHRSDYADQAADIGRATGLAWAFGAPVRSSSGGEYGLAVLTSGRIVDAGLRRLPRLPPYEARGILRVRCEIAGDLITVWNLHLAVFPALERLAQAIAVRRWLRRESGPIVVAGDLNARPASLAYRMLASNLADSWVVHGGDDPGYTFRSDRPTGRIDYILTSPELIATSTRVGEVGGASDHRAVIAELGRTGECRY
ncbi:MAG TPA: endonuclease/exonuclease/phosphatase family protein [Mycobacteriales bacterium]|nr:endonuclease/exonuclease/phosphatase family protein [Mycobacteriales bacterium]